MSGRRRPRALGIVVAAVAVAGLLFAGCGSDDDADESTDGPSPDEPTDEVSGPPLDEIDGRSLFLDNCAACHQEEGTGIDGVYPSLAGNAFVAADDPAAVAQTVVHGRGGMPAFGPALADTEIAAILSYVRGELNDAGNVEPRTVREARDREPLEEEGDRETEPGGDTGDGEDD